MKKKDKMVNKSNSRAKKMNFRSFTIRVKRRRENKGRKWVSQTFSRVQIKEPRGSK